MQIQDPTEPHTPGLEDLEDDLAAALPETQGPRFYPLIQRWALHVVPFLLLAAAAAFAGLSGDYRHIGSPAALLLLVFALSAHAGRCEARGLLSLTATTATPPMLRRAAFAVAGLAWSLLLALPAAIVRGSGEPLLLALTTGAAASAAAMTLAALTGSSFAPRVVLLIAWYVYFSS